MDWFTLFFKSLKTLSTLSLFLASWLNFDKLAAVGRVCAKTHAFLSLHHQHENRWVVPQDQWECTDLFYY